MKEIQKTKTHKLLSKIYWKLFNLTNGENKRVKHNLNKDSIVFDMGAYVGNYVESIYKRYGCNVYAFEPVERFYKILKLRFENDEKIKIFNSGFDIEEMTKFISEDGDGSSTAEQNTTNDKKKSGRKKKAEPESEDGDGSSTVEQNTTNNKKKSGKKKSSKTFDPPKSFLEKIGMID